jgi:hypothetical protein
VRGGGRRGVLFGRGSVRQCSGLERTGNNVRGLTTRAVGCVAGLTEDTSDTEVAATVDVGDGERRSALESVSEVVERRLVESALELRWVGEEVEEAGREVTSQTRSAFGLTDVDLERSLLRNDRTFQSQRYLVRERVRRIRRCHRSRL